MDVERTEKARTKLINVLGYGETLDNPALIETAAIRIKRIEQRAAEAEAHLRVLLENEWAYQESGMDSPGRYYCLWCKGFEDDGGHTTNCPRQAAAKWLSVIDGEEHKEA